MTNEKFANILTAMDFEKLTDRMFTYASGSVGNGMRMTVCIDKIKGFRDNYHISVRKWGLSQWFDPYGNGYEHEYDNEYTIDCSFASDCIKAIVNEIWE